MTKLTLKAEERKLVGGKVKALRRQGILPGSVFGKQTSSKSLQVNAKDFASLYRQSGETNVVYLTVAGEDTERPVLISNVQYHPTTGNPVHVDYHQVNLKEKVTAFVPVKFEGESEPVKSGLASLAQNLSEIEVEALPTDIPDSVVLDISKLVNVGDMFKVSDITLSPDVSLKTDPELIIVTLAELQKEEVAPTPAEGEETAPVEGEKTIEEKAEETKTGDSSKAE